MACFMGKAGEKVMFIFFWINSWISYATYYLMIAPVVGTFWQHVVYLVANAGMYFCFVTASITECGLVPTGGKQQVEYENALTMAANGNMEEASMLPLCHTCHIVRPLRSKHCSVQKRCVSCFDHFCPYVNNTMGSRNYKYFILFMAFGLVGVTMTAYHAHLVLHNLTTNEHINKSRYHYLKDDMGRFRNPFDAGYFGNVVDFWTRASRIEYN